MEAFSFFAGRDGGCGILNVADEAELSRIMIEWPFSFYSDIEILPVVDGDIALQQ
jgi:hypothetical protein